MSGGAVLSSDTTESRLQSSRADEAWHFGDVELQPASRLIRRHGVPVPVEPKVFDLLWLLVQRAGQVCSKRDLLDTIWLGRVVTDSVLTQCVAKVRVALGDDDGAVVKTIHGVGYRLDAPVERRSLRRADVGLADPALTAGGAVPGRPHWHLLRRLSGPAELWQARHQQTGESCLFKFAASPAARARLRQEMAIHRQLRQCGVRSPALLLSTDGNIDGDPAFLELPYVPAPDLVTWLDAQGGACAVPLQTRLELVVQVAEAVAMIHAVGLAHGDINPGNVLVDASSGADLRVVIVNIGNGVASADDDDPDVSAVVARLAIAPAADASSFAYLAPELMSGTARTARSDVYALGVLLYQLALSDLGRSLAPGWERDLDDDCLRIEIGLAADIDPTRRHATAAHLALRLRDALRRGAERSADRRPQPGAVARPVRHLLSRPGCRRTCHIATSFGLGLLAGLLLSS